MKIRYIVAAAAFAAAAACSARALPCADQFANGQPPEILNRKLETRATLLCFDAFGTLYSGISRTPLWSAEHLTAERVEQAMRLKRKNSFHAERGLAPADRAELADYTRSGFDRGHMAPNGDMPTKAAQDQSFSLANMVPQNPKNNQILWEGIEEATRGLARGDRELYVVTGPIFEGSSLRRIGGRVLVPTAIFKAIYDPARHAAAAYVTPNAPGMGYETISITELQRRTGIDVFPQLPTTVKAARMRLPLPTPHGRKSKTNKPFDIHPEQE